ncbi:MAG: transcription-repair coupling factor [Chloroflexi bacterium]|nr:transcription-repair coupling factor [Chloroflexota bacterium]
MNISGLLPLIDNNPNYQDLIQNLLENRGKVSIIDTAKPLFLAGLSHNLNLPMLVITPNIERAKVLCDELVTWCNPKHPVLLFPEFNVLPYERLTPDSATVQQRLRVMATLCQPIQPPPLIVASAHALSHKTVSATEFTAVCLLVKSGMRVDMSKLVAHCMDIGYEIQEIVETPGSISKRGGIIDIFSPNNDNPARIEFFGDEIESIRWFDPVTQRSIELSESLTIVPAREMLLPPKDQLERILTELDLSHCSNQARDLMYEDIDLLLSGQWRDGLQFYAPTFNNFAILDYLPQQTLMVLDDPESIANELEDLDSQANGLRQSQIERGELPRNFPIPYFRWPEIEEKILQYKQQILLKKWGDASTSSLFDFGIPTTYSGQFPRFFEDTKVHLKNGKRIIIVSLQAERLSELLEEQDILASPVFEIKQLPPTASLTLVHGSLSGGWNLDETVFLTDTELFGFAKKRRVAPKYRAQHEVFLADLNINDYVVHVDHGIGRFVGLTNMVTDGIKREYMILEYADDGKLYVPTDQVDRVARYVGSGGYAPSLSRLNTQEWARTKQKVKQAAVEMAQELLIIYASREVSTGISFSPDSIWEHELAASFPYEETDDQIQTIWDVKQDMESPKPMDRLVCGDVGYGKTEVAVRAAFKAVNGGMQVAVLVPTTVLAQQHFTTFAERLAAFPATIEVLSRFRSPKEQQNILERLAKGSVDICIGTHRLIQKDVLFKNLGLVIIDEEQKFGVAHKERLKKLRSEVDVLTLSATPIPRSFHMSLVGVRDMSTIETAPEERIPIKTYVSEYNSELVREAILRELDRNGQIFFVHNRVQSINYVANQLKDLVPEAKFAVAHGQMPEEMLESVMIDFTTGKIDVLVCTTIIESGLDMPSANTLIINQSDKLGLTQLYHLRGRVGRGDVRAYAYLLYDKGKRLTEPAQKRLRTIFEATELGAGFRIAMKDLEIRGAGNILGPEQSGHVGAVGFDLYCRLLAGAIEELKSGDGRQVPDHDLPAVDLPITAYIPEDYVTDLNVRLALYQRLAKLDSPDQTKEILLELEDRFGEVPAVIKNLLYVIRIKLIAAQAGIQRILTEDKRISIVIGNSDVIDRTALQNSFGSKIKVGTTRIRLDTKKLGKQWPKVLGDVLRKIAG